MERKFSAQFILTVANLSLLIFLLFAIFFVMLFPLIDQKWLYRICILGILISAFFCIDFKYRRYMRWLVMGDLLLQGVYFATDSFVLNSLSKFVMIGLYIIIVILLVKQAANSKTVSAIVILESVNGYLMIGMFYSLIIGLIMLFDPEAYQFQSYVNNKEEPLTNFREYLYYGFSTFTTVTYGDTLPRSPAAKSVSMAMGFTGQMYVTIIIAMLVSKLQGELKRPIRKISV